MAFLPIPIIDLVRKYDLSQSPLPMNKPVNILLGDIKFDANNDNQLCGYMKDPQLFSSLFVFNQTKLQEDLKCATHQFFIDANEDERSWMYDAQQIYFHQVYIDEAFPDHLRIMSNSLVIPWNDDFLTGNHPQHWLVEQFAGGIGGWQAAKNHFLRNNLIGPGLRTVAVESHLPYAVQFSLSHGFTILGDVEAVPDDFLHMHPHDTMFVCPIQSLSWQKQITKLLIDVWCISAPCQSWSTAGLQHGFTQSNGVSLADSISQCRIFRPRTVLVEQVAGFPKHEHFPLACKMMTWAGYTLFHAGIFDLTTLTPAKRARWLGIFIRSDIGTEVVSQMDWPVILPAVPRTFDVQLHLDHEERQLFEPSHQVASRYFDPSLMPGKLKTWTKADILDARIPTSDMKVPTFMHAYGAQHELAPYLLGTNGLFGHFVRQGPAFRFWTPSECMMIHGHDQPLILLKPARLSWETIGNSIAMPHALYAMHKAFQITQLLLSDIPFDGVARNFIAQRFQASTVTVLQDDMAWYMGSTEQASELKHRLKNFVTQLSWADPKPDRQWPPNTFYSPEEGLQVFHGSQLNHLQADQFEISPTLAFDLLFEVFLISSPGEYGVLKVDGWTTWQTLLMLWGFRFLPMKEDWAPELLNKPLQTSSSSLKIILAPHENQQILDQCEESLGLFAVPVLYREEIDLTLYEVEDLTPWHKTKLHHQVHDVFAEWEPINENTMIKYPIEIAAEQHDVMADCNMRDIWISASRVQIVPFLPIKTDILVLHCEGLPSELSDLAKLWMNQEHQSWYRSKGRQCNLQIIDDTTCRFLFRPLNGVTSTPTLLFRKQLFQRFLKQAILSCEEIEVKESQLMTLKYQGSIIFCHHISMQTDLELWFQLLNFLFQVTVHSGTARLICAGQRVTEVCSMFDLLQRKNWKDKPITIHIAESLLGGAKTTSKQDFKRLVESGIANLLLEYGLDLPQVTTSTSKLVESVGLPRLHHLLHGETDTERHASFEKLCKAIDLELPVRPLKRSHTDGKYRKLRMQSQIRESGNLGAENFLLQEGFFLNEDGSSATILTQYSPNASGVILMTPQKAQEWITAATDKSPDELGIYVLGAFEVPNRFPNIRINAPAKDHTGRSVLLNGILIQMGEKQLSIPSTETPIEINDVQIASVTLWQEDFEPSLWSRIIESPVRATKDLLALDGHQGILGKPWARVYQDKGVNVTPALASSVQFHAEFQKGPRFLALLKRSGFNKIYITPKNEVGRPDSSWKIIWLQDTVLQIESKATGIHGTAGLVKGKKSRGLRVEQAVFRSTWDKLKPGVEPPDIRETRFVFRLQPLPLGIDSQNLTSWGSQIKWDIRPIRAVGAKQWIVGSNDQPPNILMFNGQPILAQQIHQKQITGNGVIAAGPRVPLRSKGNPKSTEGLSKGNVFRHGDPQYDPWATYAPTNSAASGTSTISTPYPDGHSSTSSRSATGPVANLLQQQEDRLHVVETMMGKLQEQQTSTIQTMENKFKAVGDQLNQHVQTTKQGFEFMQKENVNLHQTIAQALQQQDQRIATSFDELKALFLSNRGVKRTTPERADEDIAEDSES